MIENALLSAVLAFVMMGAGLDIDLRRVAAERIAVRPILAGLVSTVILLPLAGLLAAACFREEPALAFGLMLLALSPAGLLAGPLASVSGGAAATAVALTVSTSLLYLTLVPSLVAGLTHSASVLSAAFDLPDRYILGSICAICVLPLVAGASLRAATPAVARVAGRGVSILGGPLLGCVLAYILFANADALSRCPLGLLGATLVLNLFAIGAAAAASSVFGLRHGDRLAVESACLMRQEGTGILIAVVLLDMPAAALPLAVNSATAMALAYGLRSWRRADHRPLGKMIPTLRRVHLHPIEAGGRVSLTRIMAPEPRPVSSLRKKTFRAGWLR